MVEVARRGGLPRDELKESDGLVAPVAAYFPCGWDEGATMGSGRRAMLGVLRVLGYLGRDAGNVRGEADDGLAVPGYDMPNYQRDFLDPPDH